MFSQKRERDDSQLSLSCLLIDLFDYFMVQYNTRPLLDLVSLSLLQLGSILDTDQCCP